MKRKQRSNSLGEALRTAREAAGTSQVPLSLAMNYDYNVVSAWENGSKPLFVREWPLLCERLPALDPALATTYADEFSLEQGRKLKPRPSRMDPKATEALNAVVKAKAPGVPVADVAREAGLDYVAFLKMLKGQANPTLGQLNQLADYFQVDVDVLLGRRPVEGAPYDRLATLLANQREAIAQLEVQLQDMGRIRKLNDLLLEQG